MDTLSKLERSRRMARVKNKDTKPELAVRRLLTKMGFRYRLHRPDLPGRPDIVFIGMRKAIFVHGCFWHRHGGCPATRFPKTRLAFWRPKLLANHRRDLRSQRLLTALKWRFLVVWECEVSDVRLGQRLRLFLGKGRTKR